MSETGKHYLTECYAELCETRRHRIILEGKEADVESVCEDHLFYDEAGRPEAVINTISYLRTDGGRQRPVMFLWNGGPGSATSTLQLECFGPYLLQRDENGLPVYGLDEDPVSILDICDLVYVDPVGVGYSRLLNEDKADKYFSLDGDARSNALAVVSWLKRHNRWNSPVYLCGESYGTVRLCRMLEEFSRNPFGGNRMMLGLEISGVILIGLALSVRPDGRIIDEKLELVQAALPTMAAVNWYHNLRGTCELRPFVEEAWAFAGGELQSALFAGDQCSETALDHAAGQLARFTGMAKDYFVKTGLKLLSTEDFMTQVTAAKGTRVDMYDATKAVPMSETYNLVGNDNMPLKVINGILAEKLGTGRQRLYYTGNLNVGVNWRYETDEAIPFAKTNLQCLREAMERMPQMKVLTAGGLYDLCTLTGNTRYILSHGGLPRGQLKEREYAGGHGVYSTAEGKKQFIQDVRDMIEEEITHE